ncbi:mechanosensitive ion channel domain-containing protein [Igneacidithiobacillus siniensis]|jgi:small conductance mechanosensitive channel|uniref:mechanosensitive ion channel family protein n=1 Tax=Acidithiobacillus TaxID=119977 RepID=UPI00200EB9E7|nr:mechanosensitive ion channel domain-containing protein [Acidithiobacillus sp. S30A2]
MSTLPPDWFPSWSAVIHDHLWAWANHLLAAVLILVLGIWLARRLGRLTARTLERVHHDLTIARFLESLIKIALYIVVAIAVLGQLGVQTTSLLAMLGAAGLAIGLALQKSLADFAAGVLLLILRPYRVGDFIDVAGVSGTVERIHLFQSVINSPDNRQLYVPNSKVLGDVLSNSSVHDHRRIDLVLTLALSADLQQTKQVLAELVAADDRVLQEPAPAIGVQDLTELGVQVYLRPWVQSGDYANTRSDLLEAIKLRFDAEGIPLAQRLPSALTI